MLRFIYTGRCDRGLKEFAAELLVAADKYALTELKVCRFQLEIYFFFTIFCLSPDVLRERADQRPVDRQLLPPAGDERRAHRAHATPQRYRLHFEQHAGRQPHAGIFVL